MPPKVPARLGLMRRIHGSISLKNSVMLDPLEVFARTLFQAITRVNTRDALAQRELCDCAGSHARASAFGRIVPKSAGALDPEMRSSIIAATIGLKCELSSQ